MLLVIFLLQDDRLDTLTHGVIVQSLGSHFISHTLFMGSGATIKKWGRYVILLVLCYLLQTFSFLLLSGSFFLVFT